MQIKTLKAIFPHVDIASPQQLRRDINSALQWGDDRLHNHTSARGDLYRYPSVQFRESDGMACLFGAGSGVTALLGLFGEDKLPGAYRKDVRMHLAETEVGLIGRPVSYSVSRFLAFNSDNFANWKETTPLTQRVRLLENVLVGNILDFCSFARYHVPDKSLVVTIRDFANQKSVTLSTGKGSMSFLCFDVIYDANIMLPDEIGLGKGKSKGFGINRIL